MKKFYIFKVGNTFEDTKNKVGDFEHWIEALIETKQIDIEIVNLFNNDKLPLSQECLGVVITGSHSMVTENLTWSVLVEKWIQEASRIDLPILGICYGHQLIAKALGGEVQNNPKGKEIGTVTIYSKDEISKDKLFSDSPRNFKSHVTHLQSVLVLPKGSVSLGCNEHDKNQIVRYKDFIWGVQFHPEFNETIIKEYINEQEESLISYGFDINRLLKEVESSEYANNLLEKFAKICIENSSI